MADYEINPEQVQLFSHDGYLLLPDALPVGLLSRWRGLADRLESMALSEHEASRTMHGACVVEDPVGPLLIRFDDVLGEDPSAVLDLQACPAMIAVARDLGGPGAVPLQMDIVFKHPRLPSVILWHQGAPHQRGFPYLNVGIYLDDAEAGDGCVRFVPGTQHELQDIADMSQAHGWDIPGTIEQPSKAGDILVQDMMVLHGSPPKRKMGVRRTVYVEIRPATGIEESGAQSAQWIELRRRWMALVLRRAKPGLWPMAWSDDSLTDLGSDETEVAAILEHREPPIPAVYAKGPVEHPDYPIPSDLR